MSVLKTPFHESINAKIVNNKNQEFLIWGEPAHSSEEIYQNLNYRKALLQTMFLLPERPGIYPISMHYNFSAEMIRVNGLGIIKSIIEIREKSYQQPMNEINHDGQGFYILAKTGFSSQFGLEPDQSLAKIKKVAAGYLSTMAEQPAQLPEETTESIVEKILRQRDGKGLRSKIPYVYVWYHDVLFIVSQISFPGYSASRTASQAVFKACEQLRELGIEPVLREAVYRREYMSKRNAITAQDTWYGMENQGKFVRTNMVE